VIDQFRLRVYVLVRLRKSYQTRIAENSCVYKKRVVDGWWW